MASELDPSDPVALGRKYLLEAAGNGERFRPASSAWTDSARAALRREPLSSGALQIMLGHGEDRAIVRTASAITRRELTVELWQIEDAVSRNDIRAALLHYDRALSVHPEAGELLFPILTGAVSEAEIRRYLAPLLAQDRRWADGFLQYMSAKVEDYPAAIDLFRSYGGSRKVASHRVYETVLLDRLVGSGNGAIARAFGNWMAQSDIGGPALFDISENAFDQTLLPFAWRTGIDDIVDAQFDPGAGLMLSVSSSVRGVAASRVVILPAGTWALSAVIEWMPENPMAELFWSVTCLTRKSKQKIADLRVPPRPGRQNFSDTFQVPVSCTAVQFDLIAQGSLADGEATVVVKSVALRPAGA